MNQSSSATVRAQDPAKAPSRLFRYRSALYGMLAITIAGAASAPMFVVQRSAQDKQSGQGLVQPPPQPTQVALAIAQLSDGQAGPPGAESAPAGLAAAPALPVAPAAPRQVLKIRRDVAGAAFKPLKVASWLPDPASYVARNSDADGNRPLPVIAIEKTPDLAPRPAGAERARAPEQSAVMPAQPALATAAKERIAPQAIPRLQEMSKLAGVPAATLETDLDLRSAATAAARSMPGANPGESTRASATAAATASTTATAATSATASPSEFSHALMIEVAPADGGANSALQAQSESPVIVVAAASQTKPSEAVTPDGLVLRVQAGEQPASSAMPRPAQAGSSAEEEVVVVAASGTQQHPQDEPALAKAAPTGVMVVSAAPAETVNLDAELRGLSLAMSTRMNAPQARLARAPELPNWAVMGEGRKLRVAR